MDIDALGWLVTAIAVLLTGISKAGLGGALGGLAVPFMSMWMSPRDAVAVMLPILIVMDMVGIRVWRGKADWGDLCQLIPAALVGITLGTLVFGVLSDAMVKLVLGLIALVFTLDRVLRAAASAPTATGVPVPRGVAWLCGAGSGFTSTIAHAGGPPIMVYLLSRRLPKERFVATSVFFFTVINLAKLPFYLAIDLFSRDTLLMSAILVPLVPLGVWLGLHAVKRIPERPFYLFATGALGFSAFKLLWDGLATVL